MASSSSATSGGDRPTSGGSGTRPAQQAHAEWATSMQAYYAAIGHPYVAWPAPQQQQHGALVTAGTGAAYGAPVPFPLYHHPAAAYYAHAPSMAAGAPHMAGEATSVKTKGKRKTVTRHLPSGEGASSSGSGDAGSQGSSEKGDAGTDQKGSSSTKRIKSGAADTEGEPSQAATMQSPVTEPALVHKGRSLPKLSVSAATLPSAAPTLNAGMDPRSTSPSVVTPAGQGEVNAAASSQSNGSLSVMDERELKRERRKQSNRDSARRSRLRKQQECEELAEKVSDLTACNGTLRSELEQLKKDCKAIEVENRQLMDQMQRHDDKMLQSEEDRSVTTTLSIQVEASNARHGGNGELHKSTDI